MMRHAIAGLIILAGLLTVPSFGSTVPHPSSHPAGKTRTYFIAAEDVSWDYAPSGHDLVVGIPIPMPWRNRTVWQKTRYIEYTDETFTVRKPQPEWLGIMGPVIRAEVGTKLWFIFITAPRRNIVFIRTDCATTRTMRARVMCAPGWAGKFRPGGSLPITGSRMRVAGRDQEIRVRLCGGTTRTSKSRRKPMQDY